MDSAVIAAKLESVQPEPSLHLDNNLHQEVRPIIGKIAGPLVPVYMPRIGRDLIVESSYDFFQETRGKRFGMPLDELEKAKGGEQAWEAAQPGMAELREFMAKHKQDEGPFVLGSQVCYADLIIVSMLESIRKIGEDLYEKWVGDDEGLRNLHEACQPWIKDDQ